MFFVSDAAVEEEMEAWIIYLTGKYIMHQVIILIISMANFQILSNFIYIISS